MVTAVHTNGQVNESAIADTLQEEITVGYRPTLPLESMWMTGTDMPQITLRRDLEFMQYHPTVCSGLGFYKSGISIAKFWGGPDHQNPGNNAGKPISMDQRVAEFVLAHVERFWQRGLPLIQEGYAYGWTPGEHIYKEVNGMLVWSHLKDFHPNDAFVLSAQYKAVGVRVKSIRNKEPVDMWLASDRVPAKGCWYAHRPRFNQLYGRSQLIGAWRPWRRLAWRDAVEQVIDAATYRAGYKGPVVRFPPGNSAPTAKSGIPATTLDGQGGLRRENRDVARQIMEYAKAGAGVCLSSEQYAQQQGGGAKWDVEWPDHVMDVRPLIEQARYLEDQILLGIGVPPELIRAATTGSGFSGRSIPRDVFFYGQQEIAEAILQMFVEQVVRPLVLWNYGEIPFGISVKSLVESQNDDAQGDQGQEGTPAPNDGVGPQSQARSDAMKRWWAQKKQQGPAALSTEPVVSEKVLNIVQRVLRRSA